MVETAGRRRPARGWSSSWSPGACPTWAGTPSRPHRDSHLFAGVEAERFYFVHSYAVRVAPLPEGVRVTWAEHDADRFVAAVEHGALCATQFHPEKSGEAGARLLRNWVGSL